MTEAQLALADIVLLQMPQKERVRLPDFIGNYLLANKQTQYAPAIFSEMQQLVLHRDMIIRTFLLKEEYIETVDHLAKYDILTEKGEKAQELGGHDQCKIWMAKVEEEKRIKDAAKEKEQRQLNWPQKNWYWVALLATALGWLGDFGKEALLSMSKSPQKEENSRSIQPTPTATDSGDTYRPDSNSKSKPSLKDTTKKGVKK